MIMWLPMKMKLYIQEYVKGVPVFLHFFYSPISGDIEFMGVDRRYESDIDGISRIPSKHQSLTSQQNLPTT